MFYIIFWKSFWNHQLWLPTYLSRKYFFKNIIYFFYFYFLKILKVNKHKSIIIKSFKSNYKLIFSYNCFQQLTKRLNRKTSHPTVWYVRKIKNNGVKRNLIHSSQKKNFYSIFHHFRIFLKEIFLFVVVTVLALVTIFFYAERTTKKEKLVKKV